MEYTSGNFYLDYNQYIETSALNFYKKDKKISPKLIKTSQSLVNSLKVYHPLKIDQIMDLITDILITLYTKTKYTENDISIITQVTITNLVDKCHYSNLLDLVNVRTFVDNYLEKLIKNNIDIYIGNTYYYRVNKNYLIHNFEKSRLYCKLSCLIDGLNLPYNYENLHYLALEAFYNIKNYFYNDKEKISIVCYILIRKIAKSDISDLLKNKLLFYTQEKLPKILKIHMNYPKSFLSKLFGC